MNILKIFLFAFFVLISFTSNSFSQRTGIPHFIIGEQTDGTIIDHKKSAKIKLGQSYLTLELVKVQFYFRSSWRDYLMSKKQLVGRYKVSYTTADGIRKEGSRVSQPIPLRVDLTKTTFKEYPAPVPFSSLIFENAPAVFSGFNLEFSLDRTSKNGVSDTLNLVSKVTGSIPILTFAPEIEGSVQLANRISDELVKDYLEENKAFGTFNLPLGSDGAPSGFIVVFAGDNQSDYAKYENDLDKLYWNGTLKFGGKNGTPVEDTTYFVFQLKATSTIYDNNLDAAFSTAKNRTWVKLYKQAQRKIRDLRSAQDYDRVKSEIETILDGALTSLDEDESLLESEKNSINSKASSNILDALKKKRDDLTASK